MCVFWLWRVPPCWYQGVGKGRRCHFLDAVSSSWRNTAADEMLAELVFEFSHVLTSALGRTERSFMLYSGCSSGCIIIIS